MTNETNGQAIITVVQLRKHGACGEQVELFHRVWGERVDVTEEEFREHASKFDWGWAADHLLPREPGYGIWHDRWTDAAQPSSDAYKALRDERREKADPSYSSAKYDEIWNSFHSAIDAANVTREKDRTEWQAVWFARLYREACGITTDEWQVKERAARAAEATGIEDELAPREDDPEQEQV